METRSEKELYKKIDMWEKKLVSANYMVGPIIDGETTIGYLLSDLSYAIDYAGDVASDVKNDYQEYHDIPKKYYDLANNIYFLTSDYMDGTYEIDDMPLSKLDDYMHELYYAVSALLRTLREEF